MAKITLKQAKKIAEKKIVGKGRIKILKKATRPTLIINIPHKEETKIGNFFLR